MIPATWRTVQKKRKREVTLEVVNKRHKVYREINVFQRKRNQKLGVAQSPSHRKILNSEYVTQTQKNKQRPNETPV